MVKSKSPKLENLHFPLASSFPRHSALLFILATLSVIFILIWALFGTVSFTIVGKGIVLKEDSLEMIVNPFEGRIQENYMAVGNSFKKGDVLAAMEGGEKIYSSFEGKVLEILQQPGAYVDKNSALFWVEKSQNKEISIFGYFPIDVGNRLQLSMPVTIAPSTGETFSGTLISVSPYPESEENMVNEIHHKKMIDYLSDKTSVIKVVVKPSPPYSLKTGTLVKLVVTVERVRPIYYILPLPQFKKGYGS